MARYSIVNGKARIFTQPTSNIKTEELQQLIAESKEEDIPPTVRVKYPRPAR